MQNFGQKPQSESIDLMCESIQKAKRQARWTMKIDTHQTLFKSIQITPNEDWYDSNSYESIQLKSESFFTRFTKILIDLGREEGKIDLINIWIDSRKLWIDLLWYYSEKLWIDSLWYYSGKFDSIQKVWHKENGQKEYLIWINESWIESSNSQKDFPIHDNTQNIKESHDTMRHGLLGALRSF